MTKNKLKIILISVALVLILALAVGLIANFAIKDTTDKPVADNSEQYELSGKVYDDGGNEMLSSMVYAMPRAMTISELQDDTVSQTTITATVAPDNATDKRVEWSIMFDDDTDTEDYLTLTPTYYGSNTAVLTCFKPFDYTAIITAMAFSDETIKTQCCVDYLYAFEPIDLSISWGNVVFGQDDSIELYYYFGGCGTVEGDLEYGELYLELEDWVVSSISEYLGRDFTPNNLMLNNSFSSDSISFNCPSPYACFAANSGIDETAFNEAFTKAIYFGNSDGDYDYQARFYFTAKYSYKGDVVQTVKVTHEGYERITVDFSLEGLFIPVDDIVINGGDIVLGAGMNETLICTFDNANNAISSDARFKVTGNQSNCAAKTVTALNKSFTKYLKMESGTQVAFTTTVDMTLKIYVDTAGKRIKIDGTNYTSEQTVDGDNVITVTLSAGSHTITKGDAMGVFALTLKNS